MYRPLEVKFIDHGDDIEYEIWDVLDTKLLHVAKTMSGVQLFKIGYAAGNAMGDAMKFNTKYGRG